MRYATHVSEDVRGARDRRPSPVGTGWLAPGACIIATAVLVGAFALHDRPSASPQVTRIQTQVAALGGPLRSVTRRAAPAARYVELLDPGYSLGAAPIHFSNEAAMAAAFAYAEPPRPAPEQVAVHVAAEPVTVAEAEPVAPDEAGPAAEPDLPLPPVPQVALDIPTPIPRPPTLRLPPLAPPRLAGRRLAIARGAAVAAPEQPSFFDKLFGAPRPAGTALAYAAPEDGLFNRPLGRPAPTSQATAIYDISAHTVYLPNGTRLEAHSGLREKIDDPRFVNVRMHGATPPAIYDLIPREALFHGVQALRLNPVGGGTTYGRTGLLAHTFMLGPSGQSNGCVSFRNYNAFLQAYQRGEVRRLVVVAHL